MTTTYLINSENAAWRIVDGEAVILSADTTYYYSMNGTATFLWRLLLEQDLSVPELAGCLAERFGRSTSEITVDVGNLIEQLHSEQLVLEDSNGDGSGTQRSAAELVAELEDGEEAGADGQYEAPALEKFDTLEKLIVSGE